MNKFRIRFEILGGHVHCALFYSKHPDHTFAGCGSFIVQKGSEFADLMAAFQGADFIGIDETRGVAEASTP